MKKAGIMQPVLLKKESIKVEVVNDNLKEQVCNYRHAVVTAVGEVSAAIANRDTLKIQHMFVNDCSQRSQNAYANPQTVFKNRLVAYLDALTTKKNVPKNESALAIITKQFIAAAADLYRSFDSGLNETTK